MWKVKFWKTGIITFSSNLLMRFVRCCATNEINLASKQLCESFYVKGVFTKTIDRRSVRIYEVIQMMNWCFKVNYCVPSITVFGGWRVLTKHSEGTDMLCPALKLTPSSPPYSLVRINVELFLIRSYQLEVLRRSCWRPVAQTWPPYSYLSQIAKIMPTCPSS